MKNPTNRSCLWRLARESYYMHHATSKTMAFSPSISTNKPTAIRDVIFKLNTDDQFRGRFLSNPVGILQQEGITLNPSAQNEVIAFVSAFKNQLGPNTQIPQPTRSVTSLNNPDAAVQQLAKLNMS